MKRVEAEAFIKLKDDNNDTQLGINNSIDHRYQQQRSPKCKSILRLGEELTELPDVDLGVRDHKTTRDRQIGIDGPVG
nr:hypothetical protein [Tanacetum cinerariifolium]